MVSRASAIGVSHQFPCVVLRDAIHPSEFLLFISLSFSSDCTQGSEFNLVISLRKPSAPPPSPSLCWLVPCYIPPVPPGSAFRSPHTPAICPRLASFL
ncbi:hypothetical protein BJV74DRAFT_465823 [Russula compacta]|nr:hypothetical protein BJV74DRAFT_465823 [Russula compacta]